MTAENTCTNDTTTGNSSTEQSFSQACALVEINEHATLLPILPAEINDTILFHGVHVQPIPLEQLYDMTHVLFGQMLTGWKPDSQQSTAQIMRVIASWYTMMDTLMRSLCEEFADEGAMNKTASGV